MEISPQVQSAILDDLKKPTADIFKVSRQYGVPVRIIRDMVAESRPTPAEFKQLNGGLGRPEIQDFILSRTPAGHAWPSADREKIETARVEYDAGTIDMATGRDGDWLILYRFPRKEIDHDRRPYFSRVFE